MIRKGYKITIVAHDLRRVVAQGCAVDEPKDGILVVFKDVGEDLAKARFSTVGSLFSDSLRRW